MSEELRLSVSKVKTFLSCKKKFKYTGELVSGVDIESDIDYTFKITGYKKMMSVGEYYDYVLIDVVISDNVRLKTQFAVPAKI